MTKYEIMLWWLDSGQLIGVDERKHIAEVIRTQTAALEEIATWRNYDDQRHPLIVADEALKEIKE